MKPMLKSVSDGGKEEYKLGAELKHWVVLTGVYADGPARVKLMNCASMNACLGCMYCEINGCHAAGAVRFGGYCASILLQW